MSAEIDPDELWNEDHVKPRSGGIARRPRYWFALVIGSLSMAAGIFFSSQFVVIWWHFHGAERISAVVEQVDYSKPDFKQSASRVSVAIGSAETSAIASVDDPAGAPDGLSVNDRVTVLFNPDRPGHALFPSQLGLTSAWFPAGACIFVGASGMAAGVGEMIRQRRRGRVSTSIE